MITYGENGLIFEQILSADAVRKCMEISLENLYVDIVGGYCGICLCVSN